MSDKESWKNIKARLVYSLKSLRDIREDSKSLNNCEDFVDECKFIESCLEELIDDADK